MNQRKTSEIMLVNVKFRGKRIGRTLMEEVKTF